MMTSYLKNYDTELLIEFAISKSKWLNYYIDNSNIIRKYFPSQYVASIKQLTDAMSDIVNNLEYRNLKDL